MRSSFSCYQQSVILLQDTLIDAAGVAGRRTGYDVVFGEPGDVALLGARTLEGLNFRIEPVNKRLVDAGPAPAAAAADLLSPSLW